MPLRPWLARANDLARVPLVLAPGNRRRAHLLQALALVAALLGGAAASHLYGREQRAAWQEDAVPMQRLLQTEQALAQVRLQLQMSEAHGRELEHQVDALNQRLRACLEEVAFFRKGRDITR